MRSLFKISLAVLALAFLVVAGSVYAQDSGMQKPTLQITGIFNTSFGQVNYDKGTNQSTSQTAGGTVAASYKAYSEWVTNFETRLRAIYGTDDLNIRIVFRPKGGNSATTGSTIGGTPYTGGLGNGNQGVASLTNLYAQADWKPLKPLMISFGVLEGPSQFGALTDSYNLVGPVYNGNENWYNWTGRPGIVAQWDAGMIQAGVGLSSSCQPSCGTATASGSLAGTTSATSGAPTSGVAIQSIFGITTVGVGGTANTAGAVNAPVVINTQTLTPYVTGKVGDITFRAQLPMTQGDAVGTGSPDGISAGSFTKTVNSGGYGAAVAWTGMPGLMVAFDYYSFTDSKNASAFEAVATKGGATTCTSTAAANGGGCAEKRDAVKDINTSSVALKANYMGFNVFYMDLTVDNGRSDCTTSVNTFTNGSSTGKDANGILGGQACKYDNTWLSLSYAWPVGAGFIIPEYSQVTLGKQGQSKAITGGAGSLPGDLTNSVIRIIGRIVF